MDLERLTGLLINFHVSVLKAGIKRVVNHYPDSLRSRRLGGEVGVGEIGASEGEST
jgi:hypothetical protein